MKETATEASWEACRGCRSDIRWMVTLLLLPLNYRASRDILFILGRTDTDASKPCHRRMNHGNSLLVGIPGCSQSLRRRRRSSNKRGCLNHHRRRHGGVPCRCFLGHISGAWRRWRLLVMIRGKPEQGKQMADIHGEICVDQVRGETMNALVRRDL